MILIVAAMDEEVAAVSERMADICKENHSHVHFIVGKLAGSTIVLMKSGVGKGSAAMSMSIAMEHYPVTQVFNVGTAGGLTKEEDVLDLVISSRVVQYDYDTSPLDGPEGKGLWFDADPSLMKAAMQVSEELMLRTHTGLIASGDRFVNRPLAYDLIKEFPKAICAEMEAGSIAQVCAHYGVPFVILRSLSDVAIKDGNHLTFDEYKILASQRSAQLCEGFVHHLNRNEE